MMRSVVKAAPDAKVHGFRSPDAVIEYVRGGGKADVAFLDIEMRGPMSGLELAELLSDTFSDINIIFSTGYSEYALDAIKMHCSGYIVKPVTYQRVKEELGNLRNPVNDVKERKLEVRTFGNFEVFVDGVPLNFRYQKTKEFLAYLIDRRGSLCRNAEVVSILWEDDMDEKGHASYLKNLRSDLINVLEQYGLEDCIVRSRGEIGIIPEKISCDYYDFLKGIENASGKKYFRGEYMSQYSWAEVTHAELERLKE
jgi:two-component SAPR family response regulator